MLAFGQAPTGRSPRRAGMGPGNGPAADPATRAQRRVDFLTAQLNLTDSQKAQALTIFTNAATSAQSVHTNMQAAQTALSDAVKKNDSAAIDQAATNIGSLTSQVISIESKADAAFYALLLPDQQAKYDAMPRGFGGGARGMGMGPRGGRGGGNPPPPPPNE